MGKIDMRESDAKGLGYLEALLGGAKVEWKPLGEVCKIIRGERVTKKDLLKDGQYPVVSGGVGYMGFLDRYNREGNTVTIAQYGTAGVIAWQTQRFWANDVCYSVLPNCEQLHNKFLYYFLANKQQHIYALVNREAYPPSLDRGKILAIEIPLPPLAVQERIVEILDKFTTLIEALETELVLRTQQYEYYRNQLLRFGKEVEWRPLGEVCAFRNGFAFLRGKYQSSGLPIIRITDIQHTRVLIGEAFFNSDDYTDDLSVYEVKKGDILIALSGATTGKIGVVEFEEKAYINQRVGQGNRIKSLIALLGTQH